MRRLSLQQRKDGARRRGSRAIILVADRRIDVAAERLRLGIFVSSEQAAEQIARILVLDVERHGDLHCKIADEHGFQHGDAQTVDVVVGAQPHKKGGEERQRIGRAGEDRPQPLAREIGLAHSPICAAPPFRRAAARWTGARLSGGGSMRIRATCARKRSAIAPKSSSR